VITLRQLLSHTSGIRHYSKSLDSEEKVHDEFGLKEYLISKHYKTVLESLSLFKDDSLLKKPGEVLNLLAGAVFIITSFRNQCWNMNYIDILAVDNNVNNFRSIDLFSNQQVYIVLDRLYVT